MSFSPAEFGAAFQRFQEWAMEVAPREESPFARRLREHFDADPSAYPLMRQTIAPYERPNLQIALDAYLGERGRSAEVVGFAGPTQYLELSIASLVGDARFTPGLKIGPVERTVIDLDEGRSLTCVTSGLFLITDGDDRLAVLIAREQRMQTGMALIEVMASTPETGERALAELRRLMSERNVYRGKVISLAQEQPMGGGMSMTVTFHSRPPTRREQIVLREGVLERIELHTVEFSRHADALRSAGRHMRRGLLLHGPPGTGKTLTATYLTRALEDRTVVILTGSGLGLIGQSCAMARELQPAMVILEDVDLVAQERTLMGVQANALLFELLNEMHGIGEDADIIFLMTTNRADLLEPALAARPGRVDQAVEFPLPDPGARGRLIDLFCDGLEVQLADRVAIVEATEGASPAFLRELVRKAALSAAVAGDHEVADSHFHDGLRQLEEGGHLTRSILGAGAEGQPTTATRMGWPQPGPQG